MIRYLLSIFMMITLASCSEPVESRKCCLGDCTGMWVVVDDHWYDTRCYRIQERVDSTGYEININLKSGQNVIIQSDTLPTIKYR